MELRWFAPKKPGTDPCGDSSDFAVVGGCFEPSSPCDAAEVEQLI